MRRMVTPVSLEESRQVDFLRLVSVSFFCAGVTAKELQTGNYTRAAFKAASTRASRNGTRRSRTPVAS